MENIDIICKYIRRKLNMWSDSLKRDKILNKNWTDTIKSPFYDWSKTATRIPIRRSGGERSIPVAA